jgi:hypothetical protein
LARFRAVIGLSHLRYWGVPANNFSFKSWVQHGKSLFLLFRKKKHITEKGKGTVAFFAGHPNTVGFYGAGGVKAR